MKQRPILFSTPMVQAIISSDKTQTRRVIKNEHILFMINKQNVLPSYFSAYQHGFCPYGIVGDQLWVRETFGVGEKSGAYYYRANKNYPDTICKWKPSIFMPRKASRILLEITDITIEKVQDISEKDAFEEGVRDINLEQCAPGFGLCQARFKQLWEKINGVESWKKNPFVWVITFNKI